MAAASSLTLGPALIIDKATGSLIDAEVVEMIDVQVIEENTDGAPHAQKLVEPEKVSKCKFGKDIDDKIKKGVLLRVEKSILCVQVGAGKKKQQLLDYPLSHLTLVSVNDKLAAHQKTCAAYFDAVIARYETLTDALTGFPRALPAMDDASGRDFVPRRLKTSPDGAQLDLEVAWAYNSLGTFDDLAAFLAAPSESRYQGEHLSQPVLLTNAAFSGKSVVLSMLMHRLSMLGKAAGWVGTVPLLPLLVPFKRIAPLLAGGRRAELPTLATLEAYIDAEHEDDMALAAALKAAVRLRAAVILLDGFDSAVELDCVEPATHFVLNVLCKGGHRVVVASRPLQILNGEEWCVAQRARRAEAQPSARAWRPRDTHSRARTRTRAHVHVIVRTPLTR